jgi:outer membrane protein|tara:strand:- start:5291 stop:5887 length:597 start_codon:yes stop_codon:yes gene_type:complete
MKNIFTIALVSTFILIGCGEKKKENKTATPVKVEERKIGSLKIAFYNQDSLKVQFKYYKEQDEEMQKKQKAFQAEVDKMTREYQDFLSSYDKQAQQGLLSQIQIQGIQEKAALKEQKIMKYQQDRGSQLENETIKKLEVIGNKLEAYSKKFSEDNNIDILLTHAAGGQLAYISSKMDVTAAFIEFLNQSEDEINKDLK